MSPLRSIRPGTSPSVDEKIPSAIKPALEELSKLKEAFLASSPKEKEFKKKIFSTKKPSPGPAPAPKGAPAPAKAAEPPKDSPVGSWGLVPLPDTPPESAPAVLRPPKVRTPDMIQPTRPSAAKDLLKPVVFGDDQPKEARVESYQPPCLPGGWQPKETEAPPPKIRGEEQPVLTEGPILGEIPPSWIGGPGMAETIQFHNSGVLVRTYTDEDGFVVTESKQPNDPEEPWLATIEMKTRIVDGMERKAFGQISFDPSKLEEEAAEALIPKE